MPLQPPAGQWLYEVDHAELSARSGELLARISACLEAIQQPHFHVRAMLAGYTPEIHSTGVYCAAWLAGQRPFWEWREWRALRPATDPDLPELVAELEAFRQRWRPHALAAALTVDDADEREEVLSFLGGELQGCCTLRAKRWALCVQELEKVPVQGYQDTWQRLAELGIRAELVAFHRTLQAIQDFVRRAPLDAAELAEIHEAREWYADQVAEWLDARRTQFAARFTGESLAQLGLGEQVPAMRKMPLQLVYDASPRAKA